MRTLAGGMVLVLALAMAACDSSSKEAGAADESAPRTPAVPATPAAPPPDDYGEWEAEAFASDAGDRLSLLKEVLKGESDQVPWIDARCTGLTGFPIESLGTGRGFAVRRATSVERGDFTLPEALLELRNRFPSGKVDLAEIKIVHVRLDGDHASTELHVHLADPTVQVNATWEAEWDSAAEPAVKTLRTLTYEECERTGPGILADSTGAVLGSELPDSEQITRGLDHWIARLETLHGVQVGGWHGVAAADLNGDGLEDLYLPEGGGLPNRLFLQQPDGSIRDASHQSGLDFLDHTYGALFVDLDNDGDQDAALTMNPGVLILENDGSGMFTPRASKLFPAGNPYSLSAADYDQDGDLDLFGASYTQSFVTDRHSFVARPVPYHDAVNGGRNELLRNEGGFRFLLATKAAGLDAGNHKFSYSGTWDDYDNDGDLDLYVANDFGSNHLYQNQLAESGAATFLEKAGESGVQDVAAGMSACWGDSNNDGLVDLYVGNMFSSAGNRIAFQARFKPDGDAGTRALYQRHARGNSLFQNLGDRHFEDISVASGTTMGRWAWSSLFADLNNDGWEDLLVANGFITQTDPEDL